MMEFFHITLPKSQKISQLVSREAFKEFFKIPSYKSKKISRLISEWLKNRPSRWLPIEGALSLCTLKIESPPPKDMLPASDAMTSRKRNERTEEAIRRGETPGQERCG